jgi:hypothetical protein
MAILGTANTLPTEVASLNATFYQDVAYYGFDRNKFDFFKPIGGAAVKPVAILFHGGGFISGDKSAFWQFSEQRTFLTALINADIAVCTVNYRFIATDNSETLGIKKCMRDGANAVQRILYNSQELGIDKTKLGLHGDSAGGSICMFLSGPELGIPTASNYKVESCRPIAVATYRPQTLDIPRWERYFSSLTFQGILEASAETKERCYHFFGLPAPTTPDAEDFETRKIYNYARRMDLVKNADPSGISLHLSNYDASTDPVTFGTLIHHPNYANAYKEKWDALGVSCDFYTADPPAESAASFLIRILNA